MYMERDICIYEMGHINMKWDIYIWNGTYIYEMGHIYMERDVQKRLVFTTSEMLTIHKSEMLTILR